MSIQMSSGGRESLVYPSRVLEETELLKAGPSAEAVIPEQGSGLLKSF